MSKKSFTIILVLLLLTQFCFSQLSFTNIDLKKLPGKITYSGKIKDAVEWKDHLGVHYLITTETGEYKSGSKDGASVKNAELYVYHYLNNADSIKLVWRIYDYEKDCEFDVTAQFIDNSLAITDLNKNGIAEVWVLYELQCTSDVSPAPAKIIMYEGSKKYALRGERQIQIANEALMGTGAYVMDDHFKTAPQVFKQFATRLWQQHKIKKF